MGLRVCTAVGHVVAEALDGPVWRRAVDRLGGTRLRQYLAGSAGRDEWLSAAFPALGDQAFLPLHPVPHCGLRLVTVAGPA